MASDLPFFFALPLYKGILEIDTSRQTSPETSRQTSRFINGSSPWQERENGRSMGGLREVSKTDLPCSFPFV